MPPIIELGFGDVAVALVFVAVVAAISWLTRLGLERDLAWGTVRTFVQLLAVGYVLKWIFGLDKWYLVLAAVAAMCITGGWYGGRRVANREARLVVISTAAVVLASAAVIVTLFALVVPVKPWYNPRYVIPLAGMIISSAMNGVAVGMATLRTAFRDQAEKVEAALAAGASAGAAARPYVRDAVKKALIPAVNALMTVGIVHLPGGMTGMMLAGAAPGSAVRYQIVIMYMITAAAALAAVAGVFWYARTFFTPGQQLRAETVM